MLRQSAWLLLISVALEAIYWRLAQLADLRAHAGEFLGWGVLAFLLYLAAVAVVRRISAERGRLRLFTGGMLVAALAFRLTLLGLSPTLSDDIHRYVWDGRIQQAGINPYAYAPDDEALASFRDDGWRLINHQDIHTVYPPLMQAAFRLGVAIAPTILAQKLLFLACDLGVLGLLLLLLPRWGASPLQSLVYAWHPLAVIEISGSGHNDSLGILCLVAGLGLWTSRHRLRGTVAFALAFLAKFVTALLAPFYLLRHRRLGMVFLGVIGLGYLPFLGPPYLVAGLGQHAAPWEFNSSLYAILHGCVGSPLAARLVCVAAVVLLGVVAAKRRSDVTSYLCMMIQATILVAPVVEPWYLLWLIPFLCVRLQWAWLLFTGMSLLSYAVLIRYTAEGIWALPMWARLAEYVPLYGWLVWRGLRYAAQKSEGRRQKAEGGMSRGSSYGDLTSVV